MEATSAPRPHGLRIAKPRRLLAALSDERLVEHVRKGDPYAFEVLYDRYSAGLLGFCRHMLGSASDAEDAVQHSFIAAHADIQRSGARRLHVKAWLYTIARNRCLSMLRARREQVSDEALELVTDNFAEDVQQRDELRTILADVRKLPDEQREALVLAEVGDMSHEDISAVLGCEATKVKSLVFQARSALIDRRVARETPCEEIREQIATLRGGALRRSNLRHHIEACPGCAAYRDEVRRQRAMLAIALPVVPSAALRSHVLGSVGIGGGGAAAAGVGGGGAGIGLGFAQAGVAKLGIAAAVLVGGGGAAAVAENGGVPLLNHDSPSANSAAPHTSSSAAAHAARATTPSTSVSTSGAGTTHTAKHKSKSKGSHRSASGKAHGFTPTTGQSNGAAARQFASTRGSGTHRGITKTHLTGKRTHPHTTHTKTLVTPHTKTPPAKAHVPSAAPRTTAPKTQAPKSQPSPEPSEPSQPAPSTTDAGGTSGDSSSGSGGGKALGGTGNSAAGQIAG